MTYVRVREQDDVILSAKLVEYCEIQKAIPQPGMFETWRGVVGLSLACVGWSFFAYVVWCVVARVWPQ